MIYGYSYEPSKFIMLLCSYYAVITLTCETLPEVSSNSRYPQIGSENTGVHCRVLVNENTTRYTLLPLLLNLYFSFSPVCCIVCLNLFVCFLCSLLFCFVALYFTAVFAAFNVHVKHFQLPRVELCYTNLPLLLHTVFGTILRVGKTK